MKPFIPLLVTALLTACGDGKSEAAKRLAEDEVPAEPAYTLDLDPFGIPLVVDLPEVPAPDADSTYAKADWVEEFGHLRVRAGARFALTITEDDGNIPRLKADLERDMLRGHEVLEETPDRLVYRQTYPDQDLVFVHFYRTVVAGDRTFVVESAAEGRFNEADITRMANAVRVREPA